MSTNATKKSPLKAKRLPPDPERQNNDRAAWAEVALRAFAEETGLKPEADEWETVVGDLLADIAHLARYPFSDSFDEVAHKIRYFYEHVQRSFQCDEYGHLLNTLYPKSQYRCTACDTVHGTRAVNGAVNWQCPRELIADDNYHEPAKQEYLARNCDRCGLLVPKQEGGQQ